MGIGRRLRNIARARRAQPEPDPLTRLQETQDAQLQQLDQARRAVADVAAQRRRVEVLMDQGAAERAEAQRRAQGAVAAGRDEEARAHLHRAVTAEARLADLATQRDALDRQVRTLTAKLAGLEERVHAAGVRYMQLRAEHGAARAALGAEEALRSSAGLAADAGRSAAQARLEAREMEARARGYAELAWTDPEPDTVRRAYAELEAEAAVEEELARAKARHHLEGPDRRA